MPSNKVNNEDKGTVTMKKEKTLINEKQGLPIDLLALYILPFIDVPTLLQCAQVSKTWLDAVMIELKSNHKRLASIQNFNSSQPKRNGNAFSIKKQLDVSTEETEICVLCQRNKEFEEATVPVDDQDLMLGLEPLDTPQSSDLIINNISTSHCPSKLYHGLLSKVKVACQHCYEELGKKHPIHGYRVGRKCWSRHRKYAMISHQEALEFTKTTRVVDGHRVSYLPSHSIQNPFSDPYSFSSQPHPTHASFAPRYGQHAFMLSAMNALHEMDLEKMRYCEIITLKDERRYPTPSPPFDQSHHLTPFYPYQRQDYYYRHSSAYQYLSPQTTMIRYYLLEDVEELARKINRGNKSLLIY